VRTCRGRVCLAILREKIDNAFVQKKKHGLVRGIHKFDILVIYISIKNFTLSNFLLLLSIYLLSFIFPFCVVISTPPHLVSPHPSLNLSLLYKSYPKYSKYIYFISKQQTIHIKYPFERIAWIWTRTNTRDPGSRLPPHAYADLV